MGPKIFHFSISSLSLSRLPFALDGVSTSSFSPFERELKMTLERCLLVWRVSQTKKKKNKDEKWVGK